MSGLVATTVIFTTGNDKKLQEEMGMKNISVMIFKPSPDWEDNDQEINGKESR